MADMDYAAFRNGSCVAIASVLDGPRAKQHEKQFYRENAGCEIKILPRTEACDALLAGLRVDQESTETA